MNRVILSTQVGPKDQRLMVMDFCPGNNPPRTDKGVFRLKIKKPRNMTSRYPINIYVMGLYE